jgi:hypothetical protein
MLQKPDRGSRGRLQLFSTTQAQNVPAESCHVSGMCDRGSSIKREWGLAWYWQRGQTVKRLPNAPGAQACADYWNATHLSRRYCTSFSFW